MSNTSVSEEFASLDDEFVEVTSQDFAPMHDFNENDTLTGVYTGSREVITKAGKPSLIHTAETADGEVEFWGTAILNARLEGLVGSKVRVIKTGQKLSTKSGNKAWEFRVLVAKGSLPAGRRA